MDPLPLPALAAHQSPETGVLPRVSEFLEVHHTDEPLACWGLVLAENLSP